MIRVKVFWKDAGTDATGFKRILFGRLGRVSEKNGTAHVVSAEGVNLIVPWDWIERKRSERAEVRP